MKITEFFDILKGINFDDEYDYYLSVHFAGNYSGSIRGVKVVSNKVVLSGEYDHHGFTMGFFDLYSEIEKLAESADTYDYDVVYSVPSKGTYNVEGAKKNHYDYSYDGDGVYDCCDIYCSDEAIGGGTDDDIKSHNLNPDDYEDFFESLLKLENKPMNERLFYTLSGGGRNMDLPEEDQFDYIDVGDWVESAYRTKAFPFGMKGVVTKLWPETKEITIKTVNGGHRKINAYTVCEVKKSGEMSESIKFNTNRLEENYQDYDAAIYRAEAVVKSMSRDFDKETVRMAFEKVLGL